MSAPEPEQVPEPVGHPFGPLCSVCGVRGCEDRGHAIESNAAERRRRRTGPSWLRRWWPM